MMSIRAGTDADLTFLERMLFEAFFWDPNQPRPPFDDFIEEPVFARLLAGWGRKGDVSLVAELKGVPVGAVWCRLWTQYNHSYGFVDETIPELGMGVLSGSRSRGVGRRLLQTLIEKAVDENWSGLSLSVDPNNYALNLYESLGFIKAGESSTSWTMVRYF